MCRILLIILLFSGLFADGQPLAKHTVKVGRQWLYARAISIDPSKLGGATHTDYPLAVVGTYTYLKTEANGGNLKNASGYDVVFFSDVGLTTRLKHETVTWNATTGAVEYHVKIPTAAHTTTTTVYMAYGNSNISTDQSDKTNVWNTNFKLVQHQPDGTTLTANDATVNVNHGTITGSATAETGQVDGGAGFNGTSQYIDVVENGSLDITGAITIETWINPSTVTGFHPIVTKYDFTSGLWANLSFGLVQNANKVALYVYAGTTNNFKGRIQSTTLSAFTWYHVVAVWTGSNATPDIYINGSLDNGSSDNLGTVNSISNNNTHVQIAREKDLSAGSFYAGKTDEVRISNTARSAAWITATYNNQNSPSTFYTIGSPF